jgi:phosphoribosylanthranilate isomerase
VAGFIKICGLTDENAVAAALQAGVDAIGFVFAPSVRRLEPAQASRLARAARGRVPCVAVMLHPTQAELALIVEGFRPDVLQTDAGDLAGLALPAGLATLPVWRDAAAALSGGGRILFEGPRSGTGQRADWSAARELASRRELVLAGGLAPENVEEAIAQVRPFGVDVSSGVEERPGRKDPARIADFVARARAAFARLTRERQL